MPELERSRSSDVTNAHSGCNETTITSSDNDVAQLSTGSDAIENLKSQLNGVGDVRQQLVDNLRQSLSTGTYKVSPDGIADKMLADSIGK
jgi:flagellar biosynthesis anti-sigma factor FlgM